MPCSKARASLQQQLPSATTRDLRLRLLERRRPTGVQPRLGRLEPRWGYQRGVQCHIVRSLPVPARIGTRGSVR